MRCPPPTNGVVTCPNYHARRAATGWVVRPRHGNGTGRVIGHLAGNRPRREGAWSESMLPGRVARITGAEWIVTLAGTHGMRPSVRTAWFQRASGRIVVLAGALLAAPGRPVTTIPRCVRLPEPGVPDHPTRSACRRVVADGSDVSRRS